MSRLPCFNLSRNALLGMRSPFSSSPRNNVSFMGFMKGSGPFSAAHVLGHCRRIARVFHKESVSIVNAKEAPAPTCYATSI